MHDSTDDSAKQACIDWFKMCAKLWLVAIMSEPDRYYKHDWNVVMAQHETEAYAVWILNDIDLLGTAKDIITSFNEKEALDGVCNSSLIS
jgi:hypothetical protein